MNWTATLTTRLRRCDAINVEPALSNVLKYLNNVLRRLSDS